MYKGSSEMLEIKSVTSSSKAENTKNSILGIFSKFPSSHVLTMGPVVVGMGCWDVEESTKKIPQGLLKG